MKTLHERLNESIKDALYKRATEFPYSYNPIIEELMCTELVGDLKYGTVTTLQTIALFDCDYRFELVQSGFNLFKDIKPKQV